MSVERRKDVPTFVHNTDSPEVTITETGIYFVQIKVGFAWRPNIIPTANTHVKAVLEADYNDGNGYVVVPNTTSYLFLTMRLPSANISAMMQVCMNFATAGVKLRITATDLFNTNLAVCAQNLNSIALIKLIFDAPQYDDSAYCNLIKSSSQVVDNTVSGKTIVTWDGTSIVTPSVFVFDAMNDASSLTINRTLTVYRAFVCEPLQVILLIRLSFECLWNTLMVLTGNCTPQHM
jgi:hypothetical protein